MEILKLLSTPTADVTACNTQLPQRGVIWEHWLPALTTIGRAA